VGIKLLEQYLVVRKELVDTVSDLADLESRKVFEIDQRVEYRDRVSKLFYMHYDFLPRAVLDTLILLHVALDRPGEGPYDLVNNTVLPMAESRLLNFVENCSLFRNSLYTAPLALKSQNLIVRENQVIKLHARHVLITLNQFSSIEDLLRLTRKLKKAVEA
jgi:hypothetical protein